MSLIYKKSHKLSIPLFLLLLCCTQIGAQQRNAQEEYNVDSALYAYYMRCKAEVSSPVTLQMSDTLFRMAKEKGDLRMQAVALCNKLDYYYFKKERDSILYYVDVVKDFALKTDQLKYYYFVWNKRLINYYTKLHQYNFALYEAQKMAKEAEDKNDVLGLANAYEALANIYGLKKMAKLAAENLEKAIELRLKYDTDNFNFSDNYSYLAELYIGMKQYDKAGKCLEESKKRIFTPSHEFHYYIKSASLSETKNLHQTLKYLQKAKQIADNHKELTKSLNEYYIGLRDYYYATKQYNKALAAQDSINMVSNEKKEQHLGNTLILGNIYWALKRLDKSAACYQEYITKTDSLRIADEDIATGEFAAILGVERLSQEKIELQQQMQQHDITTKKYIIIALIIILAAGIVVLFRERHLNNRLRQSQRQLSERNQELLNSRNELKTAKERAEAASHMKTEFIQSMSHEIRTPLNSIVGFSQILTSYFSNDDETREFATIIEQGSTNLLQLVNNVLDLSNLDTEDSILTNSVADITGICQTCIDQITPMVKPNVQLLFSPERENLCTQTNPDRLIQILMNLLLNAAKFTTEGEIHLFYRTNEERKLIIFTVKDTGIGIPEDKIEFVFERFSKVDTFVPGSGLGLAISRLVAEKMGGSLVVDPDNTSGCHMVLTLPMKD